MTLVLYLAGGAFLIWCAMGVVDGLRTVPRCASIASRVLHSVSASTAVVAAAVLIFNWHWAGLATAMGVAVGSFVLEAVAGRMWAVYLLQRDPAAADVFMRDP